MLAEIRSKLGLRSKSSKRSKLSCDFVIGLADLLPYQAKQMALGVEWAIKSGRLSGQAEMTIRQMNTWTFTDLLARLVSANISQNDVPRWLNQNL